MPVTERLSYIGHINQSPVVGNFVVTGVRWNDCLHIRLRVYCAGYESRSRQVNHDFLVSS
jgi:hypothetical protein